MNDAIDLDAYFARIGYRGPRAATRETLRALHAHHPAAIAFENLDPVMGRPVPLDAAALDAKLVRGGRGGYCFEQNGLFLRVLWALGFSATGLSARVLRGRPESQSPRSHMLMKVDLSDGSYIADVGFGSLTLTEPLRLGTLAEQATSHGIFRIVPTEDEYEVQALLGGEWETQYRFSAQRYYLQDYESLNWYRATHPASPFVTTLMAARPVPGARLGLRNNRYTVRYVDGREAERRTLTSSADIASVLVNDFGIALPGPHVDLDRTLARFAAPGA